MGRPVAGKTIQLHKIFVIHERTIVKNNKIVEPKSDIWKFLLKKLPDNINSNEKALYTAALKWWNIEFKTLDHSSQSSHNLSSVPSANSSSTSPSNVCYAHKAIKFNIELSAKVWETIKPVSKLYSRKNEENINCVRSYEVLKPGVWSNVILDRITNHRRDIPCAWVFERNNCHREGVNYLKIEAHCAMCYSKLFGIIQNEPEEGEPVNIDFEIKSLDLSRHDNVEPKNVKIGGEYAKKIFETNKTATVIRRSLLRRKASLFTRPRGRVPTANAIRCAKYRIREKEKLSTNPCDALSYLKASSTYMNTIHFIGKDPFSCIYSSPDQVKLYKAYKRKSKFTKVSADASAGVANRLERPGDEKSGQIYFFTIVISDGFQAPIHSMLSELSDTKWIRYWMDDWVERTSEIPNQFTSDMSMALLNGAVKSFTSCAGVADYIELMFDFLQENTQTRRQIPQCFIRIDIAHLMKNVTTCVALQNKPKKMRDFFIRSVAWLLTIEDLEQAKEHILSVLIVATSLTEGNPTTLSVPVPCEVHKKKLILKITGNFCIDEAEKTVDFVEKSVLEDSFDNTLVGTNMAIWLEDIYDEATEIVSSLDDGDRDNLMYNPQFVVYFMDLVRLLPLWSAICCKFFSGSELISSSGNVESHIKVVKQSMEQIIPCSVDRFVQENMSMNAGLIIAASQSYIKFISDPKKMEFDFPQTLSNIEEAGPINSLPEETNVNEILNDEDLSNEHRTEIDGILETEKKDLEHGRDNISFGVVTLRCQACKDKNWPSRAHKCITCGKNVHTLSGCSVSIGGSEGYGEKRVCYLCDLKRQKQDIELQHTEKWCRTSKRQLKKSKYRMPVPNWNLNHHFDKNVKLGFLTNGNMSLRVFGTKNNLIGLKNTCSFDAIAQVLGAVYAYLPSCRVYMEDTKDEIFEIAIALAKNDNMNRVNNMRACLLSKFDIDEDVCKVMSFMFENSPCIVLSWKCNVCEDSYSANLKFVQVKTNNDFSKLSGAITGYLESIASSHHFCNTCDIMMTCPTIKVNELLLVTLDKNDVSLAEIPEIIKLREDNFSLFGAIMYLDPLIESDNGHYVAAIKVNANWSIFDDKKSKSYFVSSKKAFHIHTLLYTKGAENDFNNKTKTTVVSNVNVSAKANVENVKENLDPVKNRVQSNIEKPSNETTIVRMSILSNGCSYKVDDCRIFLKNTCSFDSIAHILAAAFTLSKSYKEAYGTSEDEIYRIASLLASNDSKKTINNLRSKLLMHLFGKADISFVITEVLSKSLKHAPSIRETLMCSREFCKYKNETFLSYLAMNMNVFKNNMKNIEAALYANLDIFVDCLVCKGELCVEVKREFGHHLFIEIPSASLKPSNTNNEQIITYELSGLKPSIKIDEKRYSLFGMILFEPPEVNHRIKSLGHYVTAVNVNGTYFVFDDLRTTPYRLEKDAEVVIHCLFYLDSNLLQSHDCDDSSFEVSYAHTDESLYRLYHKISGNVGTNKLRL